MPTFRILCGLLTALSVTGCPNTTTRPDDAFAPSPDVFVIADAGVDAHEADTASVDSFVPDAFQDDAYAPDARRTWRPELCNGVDDDGNGLVDEYTDDDCRFGTVHGEDAYCGEGVCVCRPPAAVVRIGDFDSCNATLDDGCETQLGTPSNCAACGDVCTGLDVCAESPTHGFRCAPPAILDFSLGRSGSPEFTCIVRQDERVMCRGPNADYAITDDALATATLDWTLVDLPPARSVRAYERTTAAGPALTICVLTTADAISCRGNNDTGLLGTGDSLPHRGNHAIALPGPVSDFFTWGGDGYALVPGGTYGDVLVHDLWRWAGPDHLSPQVWLQQVFAFSSGGDMPMALRGGGDIYSWGPHRSALGLLADDAEPWPTPREVWSDIIWSAFKADMSCLGDTCCLITAGQVLCWGGGRVDSREYREVVRSWRFDHSPIPGPGGRMYLRDGEPQVCWGGAPEFGIACAAARSLTLMPRDEPLVGTPFLAGGPRLPLLSRPDWQAMCLQRRPDWWQCWGTHEGWGRE